MKWGSCAKYRSQPRFLVWKKVVEEGQERLHFILSMEFSLLLLPHNPKLEIIELYIVTFISHWNEHYRQSDQILSSLKIGKVQGYLWEYLQEYTLKWVPEEFQILFYSQILKRDTFIEGVSHLWSVSHIWMSLLNSTFPPWFIKNAYIMCVCHYLRCSPNMKSYTTVK